MVISITVTDCLIVLFAWPFLPFTLVHCMDHYGDGAICAGGIGPTKILSGLSGVGVC